MLDHYHLLVNTLNEAEVALLDDHSQELLRVFRSGYKRLNWNSLGNGYQSPYGLFYSYFLGGEWYVHASVQMCTHAGV